MNYLSQLKELQAKQAGGVPSKGSKGGFAGFDGGPLGRFPGISPDLSHGLIDLETMRPPRIARPEVWPDIVRDCIALASSGWAKVALDQGWHPLNLWGVSPAIGGLVDLEGLAIWLDGRAIKRIEPTFAEIHVPGAVVLFPRRAMDGAVLIWEMGRER